MGLVRASLRRMREEHAYVVTVALCWVLALAFSMVTGVGRGAEAPETLLARNVPDLVVVFLLVSVPAGTYVFGKQLQSRAIDLEICAGFGRCYVFALHVLEFLAVTLFVCLSSALIACCGVASNLAGFTLAAIRSLLLVVACAALVAPACLVLALFKDLLRSVVSSVLVVFAELWSMALVIQPFISVQRDLSLDIPGVVLLHPAVALKLAVLPGADAGQLLVSLVFCVAFLVIALLAAFVVWDVGELR